MAQLGFNDAVTAAANAYLNGVNGSGSTPVGTPANPFHTAFIGCTASASFTPTAGVYGVGDIIDVAKEFAFTTADGAVVPAGSLIRILDVVMKVDSTALDTGDGAYVLQSYSITPPSAQADNAVWTLASADLASYRGALTLGTPVDLGSALYVKQSNVDIDIKLTTSSLWGRLVTTPGLTATAVARQIFIYGVVI